MNSSVQAAIHEEFAAHLTSTLVNLDRERMQARLELADWRLVGLAKPSHPEVVNPTTVDLTARAYLKAGCAQTAHLVRLAFGATPSVTVS